MGAREMEERLSKQKFVLPAAGKQSGEHHWTPGSDVQSLWRRYGWTPPSEQRRGMKKPAEIAKQPPLQIVRG